MSADEGIDVTAIEGPIIAHVISDSLGDTACAVVRAAAVQFDKNAITISCLSHVEAGWQVAEYLGLYHGEGMPTAVFHTILDEELRDVVRQELDERGIPSVDLLGPSLRIFSTLLNTDPLDIPGLVVDRTGAVVRHVDARLLSEE